jgi:trimethylamine--corrinoid protein Co-methyltransferase
VVNTNSPLRVDGAMLDGLMAMARAGQAVIVTPFTLAGAMAPSTLAGALALQNAEALGVIAFAQMVRAGTPVLYGAYTSNVDMKSGAPAFGTPEYTRTALASGQLARRYGLPYRSSNACAANAVDAQAAYESEMSVWGAVMGGANLMKHGAGWMEGGLVASFEKLIVDAEILQMMAEFLQPIAVDDDTLALDAIAEVPPGGHYFGARHTLARYDTAFYAPMVSDWRNYETWREAGAQDTAQRANAIWKRLLADYRPPPLDPAVREELDAYVARRKEEGGVPAS